MAAPVFGASTLTTAAGSTSVSVAVPSGVAANTVIIVHVYKENTATVTPAAGFTEITPAAQTTGTVISHHTFWKRATGPDSTAYAFSWAGSTWCQAAATSYTGCVLTGSPIDDSSTGARSSNGTVTPTVAVTTTGIDRMLVWAGTDNSSGTWSALTAGLTLRTSGATWIAVGGGAQTAAGASGSKTGTCATSSFQTATLLALLPLSSTQTVLATGIPTAEAFGAHTVTVGPVSLTISAGITSAEAFGSHSVAQALTIAAGIPSAEAFGSATLSGALLATGIPTAEAFGAHTVTVGPVSVAATGIVSAEAFGASTITGSVLHPTGIASAETFGAHTITPGPVTLTITAGIDTGEVFGGTQVIQVVKALGSVAPKAAVLVRYELVCVARIPQTSGAPTLLQVDPIDWTGLSYTDELSKSQQLNAGAKITSLTEPILQRLRDLAHNPMELWLYRNSKLVFAGPLFGWQVQGTGQAITLQAAGLLGYLQLMNVETDVTFAQADQFTIATSLINAWQNTPYGNFGIDTTSAGASGVLRDATYLAKEQNTVAKRLEELGKRDNGFDISVDPTTRKLQLSCPIAGVDRSVGEDAIIFDERNITNPNVVCSCAPGDVASDAFGTGTGVGGVDPTVSTEWSDDLRARYGRSAVSASFDGVSDQTTLDAHVQGLLDVRQSALMIPGPDVRVTPDTDLALYDVGDTVFYRLHSQLGLEGGFRLRKRTVTVKTTGQESVSLNFA